MKKIISIKLDEEFKKRIQKVAGQDNNAIIDYIQTLIENDLKRTKLTGLYYYELGQTKPCYKCGKPREYLKEKFEVPCPHCGDDIPF